MKACPIRTNEDWMKSVAEFGETESYYRFILNDYKVPPFTVDRTVKDKVLDLKEIPLEISKEIELLKKATELREVVIKQTIDKINQFGKVEKKGINAQKIALRRKELIDLLDELNKNTSLQGLINFAETGIGLMGSALNRVYKATSLEELQKAEEFASSFNSIRDIINLLNETEEEDMVKMAGALGGALKISNEIEDVFQRKERQFVSERLAEISNIKRDAQKLKLEVEFDKANVGKFKDDKESKKARAEWVNKELDNQDDELRLKDKDYIDELLTVAPRDIGGLTMWTVDGRNTNDRIIHLTSVLLDKAHYQATQDFIDDQKTIVGAWEKFVDKRKSSGILLTDPVELYKDIIEVKDGKPTSYLTRELYSDYYNAQSKLRRSLVDLDEEGVIKAMEEFIAEYMVLPSKEELVKLAASDKKLYNKIMKNGVIKLNSVEDLDPFIHGFSPAFINKKYHNPSYKAIQKDPVKKEAYDYLVSLRKESDKVLLPQDRLGYKLPSISKSLGQQLSTVGADPRKLMGVVKQNISDTFRVQADDEGLVKHVKTNDKWEKHKRINVYFRGELSPEDQSYDLFNLMIADRYVSRQFAEKSKIEPILKSVGNIMATRKVKSISDNKAMKIKVDHPDVPDLDFTTQGIISNSFKRYQSLLADRLYGVTDNDVNILGMSAQKLATALIGRSAQLMMAANVKSAMSNLLQGKVANILIGTKSKWYSKEDKIKAEKKYAADSMNIIGDVTKTLPTSKTNLLMRALNIQSVGAKSLDLLNDNSLKRLLSTDYMTSGLSMGEHYIAANIMYSRLSAVKCMNADKQFINSKGEVVSKEDAMSIDEAYSVKDGKLVLKEGVHFTDMDLHNDLTKGKEGLFKVAMQIKDIIDDAQGGRDPANKAMIQKEWYGKLGMFLRGWMPRAFQTRFMGMSDTALTDKFKIPFEELELHDRFHSEYTGDFKQGTYTSLVRFVRNHIHEMQSLSDLLKTASANKHLTDLEKANIHRALKELTIGAISMIGGAMVLGLALGDPDDPEDDNLMLATVGYLMVREAGDVAFLTGLSVNENLRMFSSPTATVKTVTDTIKIMKLLFGELIIDPITGEGFEWEEYRTGRRKGQYKLLSLLLRQNSFYRNVIDSDVISTLEYLERDK